MPEKATKTELALLFVDRDGMNPYAAAKQAKVTPSAVYTALKNRRILQSGICPCCAQPLPKKPE